MRAGQYGRKDRFLIKEFAAPFLLSLKDKGVKVTLRTRRTIPLDPKSESPDSQTPATVRFNEDKETW
jgi:hypothetical protein